MLLGDNRLTFSILCYKNQTLNEMEAWRQHNLWNAQHEQKKFYSEFSVYAYINFYLVAWILL